MSAPVTPYFDRYHRTAGEKIVTPTPIENTAFVQSPAGRCARVVAEFSEFPHRIAQAGIRGTFLFFGSARSMSASDFSRVQSEWTQRLDNASTDAERKEAEAKLAALAKVEWMCSIYEKTQTLARLLTEWACSEEGVRVGSRVATHFQNVVPNARQPLVVCTGGGPGFMEAGNKGAAEVPGGISMGVAVTLPFEKNLNPYVTPGLNFRMEYFFTRKFWEVFAAKAMVCAPGGMGTCDEMFEVLTLMQCGHCAKMPVVLLGAQFWRDIVCWEKFANYGVISQPEVDALCFTDDPLEAFEFIVGALRREAAAAESEASERPCTPPPPVDK